MAMLTQHAPLLGPIWTFAPTRISPYGRGGVHSFREIHVRRNGGSIWQEVSMRMQLAAGLASLAAVRCAAGRPHRRNRHGAPRTVQATAPDREAPAVVPLEGPAMKVVVFGATGYIGKTVVSELAARGHTVQVFTRAKSGIGAKQSTSDVKAMFSKQENVEIVVGDVTSQDSIKDALSSCEGGPPTAVVCCLASRTGGRKDSFDIDFQATVNCIKAARECKVSNFVLLSAVCVQRPLLAFQEAKLLAEAELQKEGDEMAYSIVRPTAFFKSLVSQVKAVKSGSPFVMFGDGTEVKCKPISEEDLASFIADCLWDPAKKNAVLPIGGPGDAMSFKEQGELMFRVLGKEPSFICVPFGLFGVIQSALDFGASLLPDAMADIAEYGRIGRYYAEQSMLVLDPATGQYSAELTPGYGKTSLQDFLTEALQEGSTKLEEQKLGDQGLLERIGGDSS